MSIILVTTNRNPAKPHLSHAQAHNSRFKTPNQGRNFRLKDHALRLRRLVVKPGGVVPWHTHTDRPAIIYIISGKIVEYRSTCKTPILHKAGESTAEVKGTSHWWKNTGKQTVVLLSADLFHDQDARQPVQAEPPPPKQPPRPVGGDPADGGVLPPDRQTPNSTLQRPPRSARTHPMHARPVTIVSVAMAATLSSVLLV